MPESVHAVLEPWTDFYVIVGSAGAALTGLMFVVMTLIVQGGTGRTGQQIGAFGTPTIVHFCATLLLAATLTAPWHGLGPIAVLLGLYGLTGVVYGVVVTRRAQQQEGYKPVLEDWIFHSILPIAAYAALGAAGAWLRATPETMLFVVGGVSVLLLFIGLHNAWDTLTYIAVHYLIPEQERDKAERAAVTAVATGGAPDSATVAAAARVHADPPASND